jgi:hypothetical protein
MKKRNLVPILFVCVLAMLGASPSSALEEIDAGIYRIDWKQIDDLLTISSRTDLNVLVLESDKTNDISDAHMKVFREWVESGGVLWVAGDGLENSLAQTVAPFRSESFNFVRSESGHRGGELIVKGLSPRMTIADHALTAGVNQLYLFAQRKFDGTERAVPLVQMGDSAGNSGWVLVAVPVGRGFMILDGTARKGNFLFGRLKGFNADHPNSLKQDAGWNSYDWDKLRVNARDQSRQAVADGKWGQPTGK